MTVMIFSLLLAIVSTSFCISRVVSGAHTTPDGANDDDNGNPYVAARQRLRKQQQLQHEQKRLEPPTLSNTRRIQLGNEYYNDNEAAGPYNSNSNKNFEYNNYLKQQRLRNELVSIAKPHERNSLTEADAKRNAAEMALRRRQEDDMDATARKINPELNEIFETSQNVKHTVNSAENEVEGKTMTLGTYQDEIAKNLHGTKLLRRSASNPSTEDSSALATGEDELDLQLPYGIQNVRKRMVRHKPDNTKSITYQSLCPTKRIAIPLETSGYEYRPSNYIEVSCAHSTPAPGYELRKNRICSEAGFSCIQLNRTIHLIRRNKAADAECWESEIRIVPSGCECMWPKHDNGDIATYHGAQKRFGGYANVQANADYEQGEGYRQIRPQEIEMFGINGLQHNENADGVGFEAFEYS